MRGKFITFEGGEGTGKSTQAKRLADRLSVLRLGVKLTREPGGSPGRRGDPACAAVGGGEAARCRSRGNAVRGRARGPCQSYDPARTGARPMGDLRPLRRFHPRLSGRAWSCRCAADPAAGKDHRRRHQAGPDHHARCTGGDRVWRVPEARRGDAQADRFEGEDLAFHDRLRDAYRQLAISEPDRCVLIDASEPRERVDGKGLGHRQSQARTGDGAVCDRGDGAMSPTAGGSRDEDSFASALDHGSVRAR